MEILSIHNGDKMLSIWYIEKLFTCNLDKDKLPIPNIDFFLVYSTCRQIIYIS